MQKSESYDPYKPLRPPEFRLVPEARIQALRHELFNDPVPVTPVLALIVTRF